MKKAIFPLILSALIALFYFWRTGFRVITEESPVPTANFDGELDFLNLPEGFKIFVAAKGLEGPRVITFDAKGRMLVSETKAGRVSILEDKDKNGEFEAMHILVENLKSPHGLDFYKDEKSKTTYLYIAETHQVVRYAYDLNKGEIIDKNAVENIVFLPGEGRHFTRTIAFGPNYRKAPLLRGGNEEATLSKTKLYISVGSSCDICEEDSWKRAAILESDPEGTFTAEFAGGLRNSVFFAFHPETKEIWATEMGRDNLGDNLPPDEINVVKVAESGDKFGARRFGWPFCYGDKIRDKTFKPAKFERIDIPQNCEQTEPAAIELPAHSAPLGLAFVTGKNWPKEWQNDLLVAYHGSWNRSEPTGYKVVRIKTDKNGRVSKIDDFITGWLRTSNQQPATSNQILGRPVDLKFGPDNALYISDDSTRVIYRIQPK